ncbi:MAG TPA: hypothetical protein VJ743_00255 [Albitalea sp.]|nr:hypothetical protein [Albitalea sp.]
MNFARLVATAALFVHAAAWACGACVEDKVAATYDHAVVQHAAALGQVVVFCDVQGRFDAQRLHRAATRVRGIDAASVRTSSEPSALSFALDAGQTPHAAIAALQRAVPAGTRLVVVREIGSPTPAAAARH